MIAARYTPADKKKLLMKNIDADTHERIFVDLVERRLHNPAIGVSAMNRPLIVKLQEIPSSIAHQADDAADDGGEQHENLAVKFEKWYYQRVFVPLPYKMRVKDE